MWGILFRINHSRQKEAAEKDVPYTKSNGAAETQKWQQWASRGEDTQTVKLNENSLSHCNVQHEHQNGSQWIFCCVFFSQFIDGQLNLHNCKRIAFMTLRFWLFFTLIPISNQYILFFLSEVQQLQYSFRHYFVEPTLPQMHKETAQNLEDAMSTALHSVPTHLSNKNSYIIMLFIDFHSAFDTILKGCPFFCTFMWKYTCIASFWPTIHTYPENTATENALFWNRSQGGKIQKRSPPVPVWTANPHTLQNDHAITQPHDVS